MNFSRFSSSIKLLLFIKVSSSSIDDMRFTFTIRSYFVMQVNWEWFHEIRFVLGVNKSALRKKENEKKKNIKNN